MKVAVIGAGAAGLVCARELIREHHEVVVFEQSAQVGGVWVYNAEVEDDLLGLSASKPIFSSLYDSLRTNLPRDLMAFMDYTFDSNGGGDDYWQRYPHHTKVLEYLQNFANDFDLFPVIRFCQEVTSVQRQSSSHWRLKTASGVDEQFDAIAICNGHYSKPRVPELVGIEYFEGQILHSHNYRNAHDFKGKTVAVLGTAASGVDITREIARSAERVYWCGNLFSLPVSKTTKGIHLYPSPQEFSPESELVFSPKVRVKDIDVFMFCTGYEYQFPFLDSGLIQVTDNWVNPLYLDLVNPAQPNLAFIGLPFLVIPFPLFEMQAKWFARKLSGKFELPNIEVMHRTMKTHQAELVAAGINMRHFHRLAEKQSAYIDSLAVQCGVATLPAWFGQLAIEAQTSRINDPEKFRDKAMAFHGPTVIRVDSV